LDPILVLRAVPLGMIELGMNLENTEGMIDSSMFPVNYFSVRQLLVYYADALDVIAVAAKNLFDLAQE